MITILTLMFYLYHLPYIPYHLWTIFFQDFSQQNSPYIPRGQQPALPPPRQQQQQPALPPPRQQQQQPRPQRPQPPPVRQVEPIIYRNVSLTWITKSYLLFFFIKIKDILAFITDDFYNFLGGGAGGRWFKTRKQSNTMNIVHIYFFTI